MDETVDRRLADITLSVLRQTGLLRGHVAIDLRQRVSVPLDVKPGTRPSDVIEALHAAHPGIGDEIIGVLTQFVHRARNGTLTLELGLSLHAPCSVRAPVQ